jgi:hypothetical protein
VFPLDASFLTNEDPNLVPYEDNFIEMPYTENNGKMAQLLVSEYSLNTAIKALHERRLIKESMKISVSYVKALFPYF